MTTGLDRIQLAVAGLLGLLAICMLPAPAAAQPAPYSYQVPSGWRATQQPNGTTLTPPNERAEHVAVLLLPPQPLAADFNGEFAALRQAIEQTLKLSGVKETLPINTSQDAGGRLAIWFATYAQAGKSPTGQSYIGLMARAAEGRFVGGVFIADTPERLRAYTPAALQMFADLRIAAGNSAAQPSTAAQPGPAKQTTAPVQSATPGTAIPLAPGALTVPALAGIWAGNTTIPSTKYSKPVGGGGLTLKIGADGRYDYFHEFTDPGCTITQTGRGTLAISGGQLVMQPTQAHERRIKHKSNALCSSGENDLPLQARRFKVSMQALDYRGQASYQLTIWSDTEAPQSFLRTEPRPQQASLPRPAALTAPDQAPPGWMLGPWRATLADAPGTGMDARAADGPYRADLELLEGGRYKLHVQRPDVLDSPLCTKNIDLVEQGEVQTSMGPLNAAHTRIGTFMLKPQSARLTEEIKRCGPDDRRRAFDLPLVPRYLVYKQVDGHNDVLDLTCNLAYVAAQYEYPAWSYLTCPSTAEIVSSGYHRP